MPLCRREDATAGHGRWGGAINDIIAFDNIFCLSQKGGRNGAARAGRRVRVGRCPLRGLLCVGIGRIKTPSKGIGWGFPLWGTGGGSTGRRWRGTGAAGRRRQFVGSAQTRYKTLCVSVQCPQAPPKPCGVGMALAWRWRGVGAALAGHWRGGGVSGRRR